VRAAVLDVDGPHLEIHGLERAKRPFDNGELQVSGGCDPKASRRCRGEIPLLGLFDQRNLFELSHPTFPANGSSPAAIRSLPSRVHTSGRR